MAVHAGLTFKAAASAGSFDLDSRTWLFLVFAVATLVEIFLSYTWHPDYFRYGLPIFWKRYRTKPTRAWPSVTELENETKGKFSQSIVFRQIGRHEYAFREKAFELTLFQSTPVMHGLLKWEPYSGSITVIGHANWFVLLFAYFVFSLFSGMQYILFTGVFAAITVVLYLVQARRFIRVGNAARRLWTQK